MKLFNKKLPVFSVAMALTLGTGLSVQPAHAQLNVAQAPLFVVSPVLPALILAVDDSGSMDAEIIVPTNDGASWWHTGNQSFTGLGRHDQSAPGRLNFNEAGGANGTWKKYTYLFPNGTGTGNRIYNDATNDHFAVPPIPAFAWARSPAYNTSYFNPAVTYSPWPSVGGYEFDDAPPTAAPSDPVDGTSTFDVTAGGQELYENNAANHQFRVQPGMTLPSGTRYHTWGGGASWATAPADGVSITAERSIGIGYFPATFYLPTDWNLPAGYGYEDAAVVQQGSGPDGQTLNRYEIRPGNFTSMEAYNAAIQNFANWFTYFRKRHQATRAGIAEAFLDISSMRVGAFTINNRNNVTMRDLREDDDRESFFAQIYGYGGNSAGTPNKEAVWHMGRQFQRTGTDAPILEACQMNFGVLFTDGYSNASTPGNVGNVDGSGNAPFNHPVFSDNVSNTMADLAAHFYVTNPRTDMDTGRVPVGPGCNTPNPDPWLNCQTNLHMSLFGVTLGVQGNVYGVDEDATADPYSNPPSWPTTFQNRNPSAVDDLWHATINSRGALLDVNVPSEMGAAFSEVTQRVAEQAGSASAVAANSTRLETGSRIYQARFNSEDWGGQLISYQVNTNGTIGNQVWDAANGIPAAASRNILTYSGGEGAPFTTAGISAAQMALLNINPDTGANDGRGADRLSYLRGNRSLERQNGGSFRNRTSLLGDIVNSEPAYMGSQDFGFNVLPEGEAGVYRTYVANKSDEVLFVGANDGMLHAFDASNGNELFAYVPAGVYPNLNQLTSPEYAHRYYVDGSPRIIDAYLGGEWRTILLGSTGAGGRTVFALDVTNPGSFNQGNVLWEFSHPELGLSMSQPTVVRLADGTWAAVFGNGYNSDSGTARLFMLNLATGQQIGNSPINTEAGGDNGLSHIVPVDTNGDRVTDAIYAGDLLGNLWKFEPSNTNNPGANWQVAFSQNGNPAPLFRAVDSAGAGQAITSRPTVGRHPDGGVMVYFGTGKFFEEGDNVVPNNPQINTFYGIRDTGNHVTGRNSLQEQTIIQEGTASDSIAFDYRVISQNNVDYSSRHGWYLDLESPSEGANGERVTGQAILRQGRVIFVSNTPSSDPCEFGGSSWLMELDAINGGRTDYAVFDVNNDGVIDENDIIAIFGPDGAEGHVTGRRINDLVTTPTILQGDEGTEFKFMSGASGNINVVEEISGISALGRQSWEQLN